MARNTASTLAVAFILVGAVLLAGPTFGFGTISADRGTSVSVASDESAHLGISENYGGQTITSGDAQPLIRLENRFDETLGGSGGVVDVEVINVSGDVNDDSALEVANEPEITSGGAANIDVICADNTISGKNTVDVTLKIVEASGPSVAVAEKVVSPVTNVEIQCQKTEQTRSGLTGVWASDVADNQRSTSQTFEFTLTNDLADGETVTISLKDATKVDYTGASVSTDNAGDAQFTGKKQETITYTASDGLVSEGTTVTLEADGVDTSDKNAAGTHDVTVQKEGEPDAETTSFTVE